MPDIPEAVTADAGLIAPPLPPRVRLCVGITGHREDNPAFATNLAQIETVLEKILDLLASASIADARIDHHSLAPIRLHSLLSDGADQIVATSALARGWELVAPLPFGLHLNVAVNAHPESAADARALLAGDVAGCSPEVGERAARIHALAARGRLFELAERDEMISDLYLAKWQSPQGPHKASVLVAELSLRAALAARVMIEQSDLLVAVWDGATRALVGGTGHTIQIALETGTPVVWIDANAPDHWRILQGPEALASVHLEAAEPSSEGRRCAELQGLVRAAIFPEAGHSAHGRQQRPTPGIETLSKERWRLRSNPFWHAYRRIEALFGADTLLDRFRNLRQTYETPDALATGSAAELLREAGTLPGQQKDFVANVEVAVLRRFAWADGVSARLSDLYRGGMTASFLLAPLAVVGGIAYLPFADPHDKWMFALFELVLLIGILAIALTGQRHRWHGRWFETRRVAEYLRHAPILLLLGVARAPARWPTGTHTSWPEWYARHVLRDVGLPQVAITQTYLRRAVVGLLHNRVTQQRDYHRVKARRLAAVHHNLDRMAEAMFMLAVLSVLGYLLVKGGVLLHFWAPDVISDKSSYLFTFQGVLLPTFGGALAGIRYFGDFERFAAISSVTSAKLQVIDARIKHLLAAPDNEFDYARVADLAHGMDDVVVSEIESWQAVFGGKRVTVPV